MFYTYRLGKSLENADFEVKSFELIHFKDFLANDLHRDVQINEENIIPTYQDNVALYTTLVPELRRSSRILKVPHRFSPSLNHTLFTDRGEPENYEKAMQVDESIKSEPTMCYDMDFLMSNKTY